MRAAAVVASAGVVVAALLLNLSCERASDCGCEFIEADAPSGPGLIRVDSTATYSTGVVATAGHCAFQYRFDWGDGEISRWSISDSADHAWSEPGRYGVTAQARDADQTWALSPWSDSSRIWVLAAGPIQPPETPEGPSILCCGDAGVFRVDRVPYGPLARLEYQFDWGDGCLSAWSADTCRMYAWGDPGYYHVAARVRIPGDSASVSAWSPGTLVRATHGYIKMAPLQGPDWLAPCEQGEYTAKIAESLCCHAIEYQVDRDGQVRPWSPDSYCLLSWDVSGIYVLAVRGRCADTPELPVSQWSPRSLVTVTDGRPVFRQLEGYLISSPDLESGPIHYLVITDEARWAELFHLFTPFGEVPTPVEFGKHLVVATVKISNDYWEMEMDRVALEAGTLAIRYRARCTARDMSWTARCHVAAIVTRGDCRSVAFYENGARAAVVDIP
jgi:hypothetical protein